jgi:ubiquinone/menaquinone biosynthesis C-methylase UbiE
MSETAAFWDKIAEKYAKQPVRNPAAYEQTLERVRSHLGATDRALEIGCGTGTTALLLAPSVAHLTATDVSSEMIRIAREKAEAQGVPNVRFEQGTVFDESFGDEAFEAVLAFNLLHLLEDLEGTVARVHQLLKPGGLFISKSVCLAEWSRLFGVVIGAMRLVGKAPYVRPLRVAELEDTILGAGFEILEAGFYPRRPPSRFLVARKA